MKLNIKKYYFYQVLSHVNFYFPVITIFFFSRGLNLFEITLLQSIHSIGDLIMEIPGGVIADYFDRKTSILLGVFILAVGTIFLGLSYTFWQFAIVSLILGFAWGFIGGADSVFIHETLKSLDREQEYKKVEGGARGITRGLQAFADLLGGFIAVVSLSATVFLSAIGPTISFFIALTFQKPEVKINEDKKSFLSIVKDSIGIIKANKNILWVTIFYSFLNVSIWVSYTLSQPYFKLVHIPLMYFGVIFAMFGLLSGWITTILHKFEKYHGNKYLLVVLLITAGAMFLMGTFPSIILGMFWGILDIFESINGTLVSARVLEEVERTTATTVLSFQNFSLRIVSIIVSPIIGLFASNFGVTHGMQANALLLFCIAFTLFVLGKRYKLH